jgi:hypothetical protein
MPQVKPKYKWPELIKPQLKTVEKRRAYIGRRSVQRWLKKNAPGLRVLDIRHFHCTTPDVIEFTEVYHQVKFKSGRKAIRVKLVCSDPPTLPIR